ncbi:MAG: type I methionyl aminopeptidase [Candidatus Magasanikbacteria bacterium]|nr:type I methionyl aminopeptidase [Candidatus Magasanikbacteria bacterium]
MKKTEAQFVKSEEAIAKIREGGKLLGEILEKVSLIVKPGLSTKALDEFAEALIIAAGGRPAFLGYKISSQIPSYPATLCVSVNDEVVHGIPRADHLLKEGDIVGLDIGMEWPYKKGGPAGFYTDTAMTVPVGKISKEDELLLERTRGALFAGIAAAKAGGDVRDISRATENYLKPFGYGIVEDLVGHGVGYAVHEEPQVPNYLHRRAQSVPLVPNMVLALEPFRF